MNPPPGPTAATAPLDRHRLPPGVTRPAKGDPAVVGNHRVIGRISRNAAGTALLGVDDTGSASVIRVFPSPLADSPEARTRLEAEFDRLARVRSLCAATHRSADGRATEPWLASSYAPGHTLAAHVAAHGPLTGGMLTALAAGLAEALAAGHAVGALHLALDPSRVILSPEGPRVVDLGIARATGRPISSPRWSAPEQRSADPEEVSGYADVYAWGSLVRFAATGWEPSGEATDEPEIGSVPSHLVPLVRRALTETPEQRPTALEVLRELTSGKDPATAVSALLAAEWTGVTVPEPRRAGRAGRPALLAGSAAVLVIALLGGWAVVRPGAEPEGPGPTAADGTAEGTDEVERSGPTVAVDPEDIEAVVAEAVELALGASSFTTFDYAYANSGGDFTPFHYLYSEDPRPAMTRASYLGPVGGGLLALGADLDDFVHFSDVPGATTDSIERVYYLDPGPNAERRGEPREEWEALVHSLEGVLTAQDPVVYEGLGTVDDEYVPVELSGEDPAERGGHHYTGTFVHTFQRTTHSEPVETDFDLWISEEGYPLRFLLVGLPGEEFGTDSGEPLTLTHQTDFFRFDQPVEITIPEESEILPEHP